MGQTTFAIRLEEDDPQALRVERHGYVNLINVVHAELQLIERMLDAPGSLRQTIFLAERASRAFREPAFIDGHEENLSRFSTVVREAVTAARQEHDPQRESSDATEAVEILESVLADAGCRVHEVLARHAVVRPPETLEGQTVPMGLGSTLERLMTVLQMNSAPDQEPEIDIAHSVVTVRFVPTAGSTPFDVLSQGLPPSSLHEQISAGASLLRPWMELYYFTIPGGRVAVTSEPSGLTVTAELGTIAEQG